MLKLPKNQKLEEAGKMDDPRYCFYHRNVGHATKDCYVLKDKI